MSFDFGNGDCNLRSPLLLAAPILISKTESKKMNLKTAIASLLVGTAAWSSGVEGFNVPSGSAVGSVRTVETTPSSGNSYSNLLAQIDDANPYAQNLKSKLSMVAGGAQAEEYYEGKFDCRRL